jgi:hypothetical protein
MLKRHELATASTSRVWATGLALVAGLATSPGCADEGAPPDGTGDTGNDGKADDGDADLADCDAPPPDVGPARGFRHTSSRITAALGFANHRGRDLLLRPGDPQVVIGKLAYGITDKDIHDEDVDVWLLRGCAAWEELGTARTTDDGDHDDVEGVPDTGGRVYLDIPADRALEPGRHRVHLSVAGDRTGADLYIEVVAEGAHVFVSDVDGTLTLTENEEFVALLTGSLPGANDGAAAALGALAGRGYLPIYLTARPELLVGRTRDFLAENGFPPGLVHTTTDGLGALGDAAAAFKTDDLTRALVERGYVAAYAFGNTATDAAAYDATDVQPASQRFFYRFDDDAFGGRRVDSYTDLAPELAAAPLAP